ERQYPQEDLVIQEGMVFTPMHKVGPTLVALDEITGRIRWAYGPMVAATPEEAKMRFEAAPAVGPRTVFAAYVLDNIEGDTHIDTEYGVIAFENSTGRVRWRTSVCRLRPGKFAAGFAVARRNRILSFTSPPLYHEGTVYYNSNAGAIAALDALSGAVRWVSRYPYYAYPQNVHDATQRFGEGGGVVQYTRIYAFPHRPMFWYSQRPLLLEDRLYALPVDSPYLLCLDRRSGKILWSRRKAGDSTAYFLGPMSTGELVLTYTGRNKTLGATLTTAPVHLLDPLTGETVWRSPDLVTWDDSPVMKHYVFGSETLHWNINNHWYLLSARPLFTADDKVYVATFGYYGYPIFDYVSNLACLDLRERKIVSQRRYYNDRILDRAAVDIQINAPAELKTFEELPYKDEQTKERIRMLKEVAADKVPTNEHGPFLPFSRMTFSRYAVPFELRLDPRRISMVYERPAVQRILADRTDPESLFARAELAIAAADLQGAAELMNRALQATPAEDTDFRAIVNQQLFRVYRELARSSVRSGDPAAELRYVLGMTATVGTLSDEIETLFALSEAYTREAQHEKAARLLQSIVAKYGHYEYPTPSLFAGEPQELLHAAQATIERGTYFLGTTLYGPLFKRSLTLLKKGLPMYLGALSPLERDLRLRAGELASARLARLKDAEPTLARRFDEEAAQVLAGKSEEEQLARLWEYPATAAAQKVLEELFERTTQRLDATELSPSEAAALRRRLWLLADAARISSLRVPDKFVPRVTAPAERRPPAAVLASLQEKKMNIEEARGTSWLVLERRDDGSVAPELVFLGGRITKKLDNKFVLYAVDMNRAEVKWKATEQRGETWFEELRLKDKGDEPGFFEAFVCRDCVVVCGRYDVLAFSLADGRLKWHFTAPFDFEIRHAVMSGELLALAGQAETIMLYLPTADPRGEAVWQEREEGDLYVAPYFYGDRFVSVRKMPFNVTIRYRSTGRLMGRLNLPDLLLYDEHPLVENGPRALPVAHDGKLLLVSDGWYYIAIDVEKPKVIWKRLIDENDVTQLPPMRFALEGDYFAVVKRNYDVKAIFMLSSRTGEVLWRTDAKDSSSPQPLASMFIRGNKLYGIRPHPGQGFYFAALDCTTGKELFRQNEQSGYAGKPEAEIREDLYGKTAVVMIRDRQDFELKAFDGESGKLLHTVRVKSTGNFGEHGRASATVQNGALILLGKNDLRLAVPPRSGSR
ncbi:MAG: outer membrane protein assembly factor BamB family protein, partial [Kiritimatiellia bacterium]